MAKPVKKVVKTVTKGVMDITGVPTERGPAPAPATPVAPVQAPTAEDARRVAPKTAVSLGGEDQMAATQQTTRRRRAAGMQTGGRGLITAARTERKRLLGQ